MEKAIAGKQYLALHSILISKGNAKPYQRYFNSYGKDSLHDSRSSFKSVASLLIGVAIDKGWIKSVDQPIQHFFPNHPAFKKDPRKKKIRIKDLLEMRSGLDCDEWSDNGKDCESEMEKSNNWVDYSLSLPMKTDPGKQWAYTSCNTMLLSGIISKATGKSIMKFAEESLFKPLQMSNYRWTLDPSGQGMTAGSFYIKPSDMLKFGQLILNNGKWKGKQLISKSWISESTSAKIPIPEQASFVKTSRSKAAVPQQTYYGYSWYNEKIQIGADSYDTIIASGNGGQYVFTIPSLDLVVVFTQGNYGSWKAKQAFDILAKYIIPAYR